MKPFTFKLERVMDWRRTQARIEELKLENLNAELRGIGQKMETIALEKRRAGRTLVSSGEANGLELSLLDSFRRASDAELIRLERSKAECRSRIDGQMLAVSERRRDVRLLEKLRERKLQNWKIAAEREVDLQAEEAYLGRWNA